MMQEVKNTEVGIVVPAAVKQYLSVFVLYLWFLLSTCICHSHGNDRRVVKAPESSGPKTIQHWKNNQIKKKNRNKTKAPKFRPKEYKILGNKQNEEKVWQQDTMLQNPDPIKQKTKTKSQYHEIAPHMLRKGREDNFDLKALQNEKKIL